MLVARGLAYALKDLVTQVLLGPAASVLMVTLDPMVRIDQTAAARAVLVGCHLQHHWGHLHTKFRSIYCRSSEAAQ